MDDASRDAWTRARASLAFAGNDLSSLGVAVGELRQLVHRGVGGHQLGDLMGLRLAEASGSVDRAQEGVQAVLSMSLDGEDDTDDGY